MSSRFCGFDSVLPQILDTFRVPMHSAVKRVYVIRDLYGRVRLAVSEAIEEDGRAMQWLRTKAKLLQTRLGVRSYPPEDAILFLDAELLSELHRDGRKILENVFLVDRLITGAGWWSVDSSSQTSAYTLHSMKGGVGRSTTAAVLAWHLAQRGENVLVVDLDLESPGLSSAMLEPSMRPDFGVVDWFVEDMVGQGDRVIEGMIARPGWQTDLQGEVCVVPAHGANLGEYLAKLGRVYLDKRQTMDGDQSDVQWAQRLEQMLQNLRQAARPTTVLLDSCSGLHDIAAATVTDLSAHALLFGTSSETSWHDYGILFEHWKKLGLARDMRDRLSIVSSLTPDIDTEEYIRRFRERSWALFQDHLYDDDVGTDAESCGFAFELLEDHAPHDPMPIHWTRCLAAGESPRRLEGTIIEQAYGSFLARFDALASRRP